MWALSLIAIMISVCTAIVILAVILDEIGKYARALMGSADIQIPHKSDFLCELHDEEKQ